MSKTLFALATVFALVSSTNQTAQASPVGGTIKASYTAKPNTNEVYNPTFYGGESVRIRVSGDGDTPLELRIYDENGNLVASDTAGFGDDRGVVFTPKWTGKFTVKVRNTGTVGNKYVIMMD